jgi:hypothetical protein
MVLCWRYQGQNPSLCAEFPYPPFAANFLAIDRCSQGAKLSIENRKDKFCFSPFSHVHYMSPITMKIPSIHLTRNPRTILTRCGICYNIVVYRPSRRFHHPLIPVRLCCLGKCSILWSIGTIVSSRSTIHAILRWIVLGALRLTQDVVGSINRTEICRTSTA